MAKTIGGLGGALITQALLGYFMGWLTAQNVLVFVLVGSALCYVFGGGGRE